MPAFLVVHTIPEVPFALMVLMDNMRRGTVPVSMQVRQVLPTSGLCSTSLWDAPDAETLVDYVRTALGQWCTSEIYPVVEDACYGLEGVGLLGAATHTTRAVAARTTAAAASAVAAGAGVAAAGAASLDKQYKLSEAAASAVNAAHDVTGKSVAAASSAVSKLGSIAMENEAVASVVNTSAAAASAGIRKLNVGFNYFMSKVTDAVRDYDKAGSLSGMLHKQGGGTEAEGGMPADGQLGEAPPPTHHTPPAAPATGPPPPSDPFPGVTSLPAAAGHGAPSADPFDFGAPTPIPVSTHARPAAADGGESEGGTAKGAMTAVDLI